MDTDTVNDTDTISAPEATTAQEVVAPKPLSMEGLEQRIAVRVDDGQRDYPSLYDSQYTTIIAVVLGLVIVGGIQVLAWQIYRTAKSEYRALTQFVTMMVGLVLGAYMADLLIAGPSTSLLSDDEHTVILGFVKDICLMVFSYYFGTRSNGGKPETE